jgi:hypothetical protein
MSRRRVYAAGVGVWLAFLAVAFGLGAVREILVSPLVGEPAAHVLGTLAVIAVFLGVMLLFVRWAEQACSAVDFWLLGLLWLAMTVGFELVFFHFVAGKPWHELVADYNLARGRIWILVLLTMLLGPRLLYGLRRRQSGG